MKKLYKRTIKTIIIRIMIVFAVCMASQQLLVIGPQSYAIEESNAIPESSVEKESYAQTNNAVETQDHAIDESSVQQKSYADTENSEEEDSRNKIVEQQSETAGLNEIIDKIDIYSDEETKQLLEDYNPEKIVSDAVKGRLELSPKGLLNSLLRYLFKELYKNMDILIKLAVLIVICSLLKNLQTAFLSEGTSEIAFYVCYIVIISILLVSFSTAVKLCSGIINDMVNFMHAIMPVLVTLLISGGSITTGGVIQPLLITVVELSATLIKTVFLPLIYLSAIITIINNISDKIQLAKLAAFIKQITTWAIGCVLTIFIAIVSIQGTLGAVVDGVTTKTAKFAISTFIPIVGKTLSDAADTVIGCTLLIKNAAGILTMIGVLTICIVPLIKIIALVGLYKAAGALLEPLADKRISNCISDVAGSMLQLFALSAAVSLMFLISVTVLISAGNVSAMLR